MAGDDRAIDFLRREMDEIDRRDDLVFRVIGLQFAAEELHALGRVEEARQSFLRAFDLAFSEKAPDSFPEPDLIVGELLPTLSRLGLDRTVSEGLGKIDAWIARVETKSATDNDKRKAAKEGPAGLPIPPPTVVGRTADVETAVLKALIASGQFDRLTGRLKLETTFDRLDGFGRTKVAEALIEAIRDDPKSWTPASRVLRKRLEPNRDNLFESTASLIARLDIVGGEVERGLQLAGTLARPDDRPIRQSDLLEIAEELDRAGLRDDARILLRETVEAARERESPATLPGTLRDLAKAFARLDDLDAAARTVALAEESARRKRDECDLPESTRAEFDVLEMVRDAELDVALARAKARLGRRSEASDLIGKAIGRLEKLSEDRRFAAQVLKADFLRAHVEADDLSRMDDVMEVTGSKPMRAVKDYETEIMAADLLRVGQPERLGRLGVAVGWQFWTGSKLGEATAQRARAGEEQALELIRFTDAIEPIELRVEILLGVARGLTEPEKADQPGRR